MTYPINMANGIGYACANDLAEFKSLQLMGYVSLGAGPLDGESPSPINDPLPSDPAPSVDPVVEPVKRGRKPKAA